MASWSGQIGPVRALLQANGTVGRAKGGTAGIPGIPTTSSQRGYDILSGAAVAYAEVDLGTGTPFVGLIIGTPDGDPMDRELHGFAPASWSDITGITGVSFFEQPRYEYELCRAGLFLSSAVAGGTDVSERCHRPPGHWHTSPWRQWGI